MERCDLMRNIQLYIIQVNRQTMDNDDQTLHKQRIKNQNLRNTAFHPLPLSQVSMLLQNLQQLPQVGHLMRVMLMSKKMHKDNISRLAPKTRRRGGLKKSKRETKVQMNL